MDKIWD